MCHGILFLRKEGDSNPRYGYPYDSLANCWFQPLTHPSPRLARDRQLLSELALFPKSAAKVLLFFDMTKYFGVFFKKTTNLPILALLNYYTRAREQKNRSLSCLSAKILSKFLRVSYFFCIFAVSNEYAIYGCYEEVFCDSCYYRSPACMQFDFV